VERLRQHFENAKCCIPQNRQIGIEIETLFVDQNRRPIDKQTSQKILTILAGNFNWAVDQIKNGYITQLSKDGFILIYELGCNNLELYTPTYHFEDSSIFITMDMLMAMLKEAAHMCQATPLHVSWDEHLDDNLMIPDKRDEIWVEVDGSALLGLGHIASIQFNIDLCSIEEGMGFIKELNHLYTQMHWPHEANFRIWRDYIKNSLANYEHDRYAPAPASFEIYIKRLSQMKVIMQKNGNGLQICRPAKSFAQTNVKDIEMFLRSVWWYTRFRVRNGKLVLEIRDIDRNGGLHMIWDMIRLHLNI